MSDPGSLPHASGVKNEIYPSVTIGVTGNNGAAIGDKERYAAAAAAALAKGDKRSVLVPQHCCCVVQQWEDWAVRG